MPIDQNDPLGHLGANQGSLSSDNTADYLQPDVTPQAKSKTKVKKTLADDKLEYASNPTYDENADYVQEWKGSTPVWTNQTTGEQFLIRADGNREFVGYNNKIASSYVKEAIKNKIDVTPEVNIPADISFGSNLLTLENHLVDKINKEVFKSNIDNWVNIVGNTYGYSLDNFDQNSELTRNFLNIQYANKKESDAFKNFKNRSTDLSEAILSAIFDNTNPARFQGFGTAIGMYEVARDDVYNAQMNKYLQGLSTIMPKKHTFLESNWEQIKNAPESFARGFGQISSDVLRSLAVLRYKLDPHRAKTIQDDWI